MIGKILFYTFFIRDTYYISRIAVLDFINISTSFSLQIAETYSFLPREAVTRFLMACTDCQKRMHISPDNSNRLEINNEDHHIPLCNGAIRPHPPPLIDFR